MVPPPYSGNRLPDITAPVTIDGGIGGDLITYTQADWGDNAAPANAAGLLTAGYSQVYLPAYGTFVIGSLAGYAAFFGSAASIEQYLPATGAPGPLTMDYIDPTATASGEFGGDVAALQLNIDFADAGLLLGSAGLVFGNLHLCNDSAVPSLSGLTVRQVLGVLNTALSGGAAPYGYSSLDLLAGELQSAFFLGPGQPYAQAHLVNGACP